MTANDHGVSDDEFFEIRRLSRIEVARRAAADGDILKWGKVLFPEKFDLPYCRELHGYFVAIRGAAFTNTEAPRNHAKTTIKCFLIPLFQALNEPSLFRHYLNVQSTNDKALTVNRAIKSELENNLELREIYGDQVGARWTDQQFALKNGVAFTAIGAGQSIRGINYNSVRPDYLIVDDLYDDEDINNPDGTIKKNDWFWSALYPARAKTRRCSIHVQGTAINNEDLLEQLKKREGVAARTFRAIKDWDKKTILWPELNTFESLEQDRALMGSVIFFREMQNERRESTTAIIKREWIKEYNPRELRFNSQFVRVAVRLGVDPSIGEKVENDFTAVALVVVGQYTDGRGQLFYIENVWNAKLSLNERVNLLQRIQDDRLEEFKVSQARIEAIAGFKDFVSEVKRRTALPVKEIDHVKDKISTLESKSHFFENGKVFINMDIAPALKDTLIHQLTTNHPLHDDLRDAVLLTLDASGSALSWI